MEKYEQIINLMKENKVDITRLYIYDIIRTILPKEEHEFAVDFVYDTWLDIDDDLDLARLTDVICENWVEIKKDEFDRDDIINAMF